MANWSFETNLMSLLLLLLVSVAVIPHVFGCYNSVISFGDSLADTGNLYITYHGKSLDIFHPPYGETYFHHPTGRCSDGRLVIDFIAEYLGLPPVPPYLQSYKNIEDRSVQNNFEEGMNFAVAGATALDAAFLRAMGDQNPYTNNSLGIQLDWFKQMLSSLCNTSSECKKVLSSSLIVIGEIGGNDYNYASVAGKSTKKVETYVPLVTEQIASTINELIELGAATVLVAGMFPLGCIPVSLTNYYESSDKNGYDPSTGCLNWLNKFAESHNEMLQIEISRIQRLHPHAKIIYADYYNAFLQLYQSPNQFGFFEETWKACCGGGGPYNYNSSAKCGSAEASACENPAQFISWDGVHFTEAAYRWIAMGLIRGIYTIPPFAYGLCVSQM